METVPGHRAVGLDRFVFVGVRDLSEAQRGKLERSEARVLWGGGEDGRDYGGGLEKVLGVRDGGECAVHVDLDCLDTGIGLANEYAAPGGLSGEDLRGCLEVVGRMRVPVSFTVASFNPGLEGGERIADVAVDAIVHFVESVLN